MTRFIIIFFLFFGILIFPIFVFAENTVEKLDPFTSNLLQTSKEGGFLNTNNAQPPEIEKVTGQAIGFLLSFTSLIFFFWFFYGAYQWLLAKGNDEKIQKAQKTIRAALWGIFIIALSYLILKLILELLALGDVSLNLYG